MANPYNDEGPQDAGRETGIVAYILAQGDTLFLPMCLIAAFLTVIEWMGWL